MRCACAVLALSGLDSGSHRKAARFRHRSYFNPRTNCARGLAFPMKRRCYESRSASAKHAVFGRAEYAFTMNAATVSARKNRSDLAQRRGEQHGSRPVYKAWRGTSETGAKLDLSETLWAARVGQIACGLESSHTERSLRCSPVGERSGPDIVDRPRRRNCSGSGGAAAAKNETKSVGTDGKSHADSSGDEKTARLYTR